MLDKSEWSGHSSRSKRDLKDAGPDEIEKFSQGKNNGSQIITGSFSFPVSPFVFL
jgi:hypothetical protein